jgi:polar amino acid transport system permease protein
MGYFQRMRRTILPQAIRRTIPPFINEFATLMKMTTLGSVLAVNELLHEGENLISNTYRPLEIYTAIAILFGLMIYPVIWLSQYLERYWNQRA